MKKFLIPLILFIACAVSAYGLQRQTIAPAPPPPNPITVYLSPMTVTLPATSAIATFTSSTVNWTGKNYDVFALYAGITGSPSGCTLTPKVSADGTNFVNQTALTFSPANGVALPTSDTAIAGYQVQFTYSCSTTYPTAGTLQIFVVMHHA